MKFYPATSDLMADQSEKIGERIEYYLAQGYTPNKAEIEAENDVLGPVEAWEPKPCASAAWATWAARDARNANMLLFAAHSKWVTDSPELLTRGIRDAYLNGLEIVIPTDEKELGWAVKL